MSVDSFFLRAQSLELDAELKNARIDKIFMPRPTEIVLALRSQSGNVRLMVSCGLTDLRPENPPAPPMFCMLLRKHMQGGKILSVTQPEGERLLQLTFTSTDELGRVSEKRLMVELIGKRTNLLLLDEEGIILGCVKKVDYEMSDRAVLPGLMYRMPPRSEKPRSMAKRLLSWPICWPVFLNPRTSWTVSTAYLPRSQPSCSIAALMPCRWARCCMI